MNIFNFLKRSDQIEERSVNEVDINGLTVNYDTLTPNEALCVNAVHSCVNIIAGSIARLPMCLYRKTEDGRKKAVNHRLFDLPTNPNPDMTSMSFFYALVENLLLYGNAYCQIIRVGRNKSVYLNLIPSKYVTINVANDGTVTYTVTKTPNKSEVQTFKSKDILHIVGETQDGIKGDSPVKLLDKTVKFARIMEKYGLKYFENGANPTAVLYLPEGKVISSDAVMRLKKQMRNYIGVDNIGKIVVLDDGAQLKPTQMGNDASQFLQTKESLVEEIARIFNVPLHLLQKVDKSTSWGSGIEQMGIDFVRYTLDVHLKRIEQAFNKALLDLSERKHYYFEFNIDAMLRGDQKARYEAYEIALRCGFISPNEIRQKENMPPIEGGDVYCMQLNQPPYAGADIDKFIKDKNTDKEENQSNGEKDPIQNTGN